MALQTKVFELAPKRYRNLTLLAEAMGLSVSQVYRVRKGERSISEVFIVGALKAFPGYGFNDLFVLDNSPSGDMVPVGAQST